MKKIYNFLFIFMPFILFSLAIIGFGTMEASAQSNSILLPVKMTYVDYDAPDISYGEQNTIHVGYNKAPSVGGAIGFGNRGWGENKIGILEVDVSSVFGTVQKATLKAKISGSSDSKRTTGWGMALTDNDWSTGLTYNAVGSWVVSALLNNGDQVWSTTKSSTVYVDASWDITEAFTDGRGTATILVYETAAAGGYMTEAEVEVEYKPLEPIVTYDFEDGSCLILNKVDTKNLKKVW